LRPTSTSAPPAATAIRPTAPPPPPSPASSPRATVVASPATATPLPPVAPTIHYFEMLEVQDTDYGKRITFNWSAEGVEARLFSGTRQRFQDWWVVPLSGTQTVEARGTVYRDPLFTVEVSNSADWFAASTQKARKSIRVEWACEHAYFFEPAPTRCPLRAAALSPAAEQRFERGRMIWLDAEDAIYVFFDQDSGSNGRAQQFEDTWMPGELESDPEIVPPEGLYQPVRGFGKVWRDNPQIRDRLGWAIAPEQGFEGALQHEHHEGSSSGAPTFLRTADGQVIWWWPPSWGFVTP